MATSPLDSILQGARKILDKGQEAFRDDSSALGIAKNTFAPSSLLSAMNKLFFEQSTAPQQYLKKVTGLKSPAETQRELLATTRANQLPTQRLDQFGLPASTIGKQTTKVTDILKTATPKEKELLALSQARNLTAGFAGYAPQEKALTSIAPQIAKSTDIGKIANLLKKEIPSLADDTANNFARVFKDLTDPKAIDTAINKIKFQAQGKTTGMADDLITNVKAIMETGKPLPRTPVLPSKAPVASKVGSKGITPEIVKIPENPLIQDPRKYKSAKEFVKAQGQSVFRGGDTAIDTSRGSGRGISVSDKETARLFTPPKGGVVDEAILPKTAKILKEGDIPKSLQDAYIKEAKVLADPNNFSSALQKSVIEKQQAIIEYARKNGFDAVEFPFEKEIRIVKPDVLKTKSQLTDIWNKAQEATPEATKPKKIRQMKTSAEIPSLERTAEMQGVTPKQQVKADFNTFAAKQNIPPTKNTKVDSPLTEGAENLKDISGFRGQNTDVYRNFKTVFGKGFNKVKKAILDPFDEAKGVYVDTQRQLTDELNENIIKKLGITKGSKASRAVMDFGEGIKDYSTLVKEFGKKRADNIVEADKWFRAKYDDLIKKVNKVREQIYPNQPDKLVPYRKDYYRHFQELGGISGLKNIFETPAGIDPKLSGISPYTKPKSKFLSFAQRRFSNRSERDAVGGFINYIPSYSYATNIDPQIGNFRALAKDLAEQTQESRNLNNFIEFLNDYANDLSGKTNSLDRYIQKVIPGGRKTLTAIDWLNKRVKANTILGNVSSSLAQIFNVPQAVASAKQHSASGFVRTVGQLFVDNKPMQKSNFIKERYASSMYNKFDRGMLQNTKKFAAWMVGALDEVGTKFAWNAHYEKALAEGIENPIKYADDMTRSLVAGRGVGEVPLIQKSKIFQLVAPFQLEVNNLWYVIGDFVKAKDFGAIAILFGLNYLMNRGVEQVRGSDVVFDPINATIEGVQMLDEENGKAKFAGRLAGEVLSNMPLGQTVAAAYPEFGVAGLPTRSEFFGQGDPTRYGSGLLAIKGLQDPLYKVLPPFAGGQVKKTVEGTKAFTKGVSLSKTGRARYPIAQTPGNFAKTALFGQYATPEAREFFDKGMKARSVIKTEKELAQEVLAKLKSGEFGSEAVAEEYLNSELKKIEKAKKEERFALPPKEYAQELLNLLKAGKMDEVTAEKELNSYLNQPEIADRTTKYVQERGTIGLILDYGKALTIDPSNAFKAMTPKAKLGIVEGNLVEMQRFDLIKYDEKGGSDEYKKKAMQKLGIPLSDIKKYKLEHIVPVKAGGDSTANNLLIVTNDEHNSYTRFDTKASKMVQDKQTTRRKVTEIAIKLKIDKTITVEEALNML